MDYTSMGFAPTGAFAPGVVYGGFWIRVGAYVLDGLLLLIGQLILSQLMASSSQVSLLSGLIGWLYFAGMESSANQATLGKRAMGLQVTDLEGDRIGFGKATGRYFAKIISALILFIGYFMIGFTEKKQGLHDMIAGTLVIKNR